MKQLVMTAKLFSCRPSSLLQIGDPWVALAFDLAAGTAMMEAISDAEQRVADRICL